MTKLLTGFLPSPKTQAKIYQIQCLRSQNLVNSIISKKNFSRYSQLLFLHKTVY